MYLLNESLYYLSIINDVSYIEIIFTKYENIKSVKLNFHLPCVIDR